jgi:D-arabinose 1-dehydrogenase-like Zn-dependent alcohol dehydrogenase
MKAAILSSHGQPFKFDYVDIPTPKENEILMKTIACGCCHTDIHVIDGDWFAFNLMKCIT